MSGEDGHRTSLGEWIVAGVGAVLVLGATATLVWDAVAWPDTPPDLTTRVTSVTKGEEHWTVEVEVHNAGGQTAADLEVEGVLEGPEGEERSEARLMFLPPGGTQTVGLLFARDPAAGRLEVRPTGYTEP